MGRDPAGLGSEVWSEAILEIRPTGLTTGEVVWAWHAWDHLVQNFDPDLPNFGEPSDHPERIDINFTPNGTDPDWLHFNGLDFNEELDQIIMETEPGPPITVASPEAWPDDVRRAAERLERESSKIQFTAAFERTCREAGVFVGEIIRLRDPTRYWTIVPGKHFDQPNNLLSLCSTIKNRTIYLPTRMIVGTMYRNHVWCDTVEPYKSGIAQLIRTSVGS